MTFGMKIQSLRDRRGQKACFVADVMGLSKPTLSTYEQDRRCPNLNMVKRFAEFYEVDWHELLAEVD